MSDAANAPDAASPLKGRSFLVCEDEGVIILQVQKALRNAGAAGVLHVNSAEAAVTTPAADRPDVILMDVGLEGDADGWEAARRILTADQDYRPCVIMLTGQATGDVLRMSKAVPVAGHVAEPILREQLIPAIEACVSQYRTQANA